MNRNIFLFLLLAIIIQACKKEHVSKPPFPIPAKIVKQISASATDFRAYEYDAAGKVSKFTMQWDNGTGQLSKLTQTYTYAGEKLIKNLNNAGYTEYYYEGDKLIRSEHFFTGGAKLSTLQYSYNTQGQLATLVEKIANPDAMGIAETRINYQYYSSGNVKQIDFAHRKASTDPFTLNFSKIYEQYDENKNPEPDIVVNSFIPNIVLFRNNPIKINTVLANGSLESYQRYEYTYNADGFPIEKREFQKSGNTEHGPLVFQYHY